MKMFFRYDSMQFSNLAGTCPQKFMNDFSVKPRSCGTEKEGAVIVTQYLETLSFLKSNATSLDSAVDQLYAKAKKLDAALDEDIDEDRPTMYNLMTAAVQLKTIPCSGLRWQNTVAGLKLDILRYGAVLVETMMMPGMTTTAMTRKLDIAVGDESLYGDFAKGFIAWGYDKSYIYLQNSLGASWGSYGSGRVSWTDFSKRVNTPDGTSVPFFIKSCTLLNSLNK